MKELWHQYFIQCVDLCGILFCFILALLLKNDFFIKNFIWSSYSLILVLFFLIHFLGFYLFKIHKTICRYSSLKDLTQIIKSIFFSFILSVSCVYFLKIETKISFIIIFEVILLLYLLFSRYFIRYMRPFRKKNNKKEKKIKKRILIIGAGDAGEIILRELLYHNEQSTKVIGLIDDDKMKIGRRIHGIEVLSSCERIPNIVEEFSIDEIIIAIPSLSNKQMRRIVDLCITSSVKYRTLPHISDLIDGKVKIQKLRDIKLEDLLGRDEIKINYNYIKTEIENKVVLITGAGGSIGSEICRQVSNLSPSKIILFERSENSLFYIDLELHQKFPQLNIFSVIGDICDKKRVSEILVKHKPDVIFHAAAHKHVPLMEKNPFEAIKNNLIGTKTLAEESIKQNVKRFVMLSTDKAVEPSSIMGVSKRLAEIFLQSQSNSITKFVIVRFGNVLGSEGSIIPVLKKQIESGGPITITHPESKRFFMTIPEAVGLVLESSIMGKGSEIYILDMQNQIKIVDLAKDLIRLIKNEIYSEDLFVYTGLRPGEKIEEKLYSNEEILKKTSNNKIYVIYPKNEKTNLVLDINDFESLIQRKDKEKLFYLINKYISKNSVSDTTENLKLLLKKKSTI